MAFKRAPFIIKGMTRDLAVSKFSSEYAFENKNMRITATDDNTSFALVNEKGNVAKDILWDDNTISDHILGTPIGQQVLGKNLVLFTTGDEDCIYKFWFSGDTLKGKKLFQGNLHFSAEHPIESIGVYENDELQKVYWTDGITPPKFLNIEAPYYEIEKWNENHFLFVPKLLLKETVSIERNTVASGTFAPGVIQYVCTYYNLNGQETNIFYTSPLYYVSYNNRGASPDDVVSNSFTLSFSYVDTNFDYLRVYSIHRTSLDATPQVRRVVDIAIPNDFEYQVFTPGTHYELGDLVIHDGKIYKYIYDAGSAYIEEDEWDDTDWELAPPQFTYIDNGNVGEIIDATTLLYIGGESIIVGTLSQKDNTLFLGDIKYDTPVIPGWIQREFRSSDIEYSSIQTLDLLGAAGGFYNYTTQLSYNSNDIKGFKYLEYYRFGLQFQTKFGRWSAPIWLSDVRNTVPPHTLSLNSSYIYKTIASTEISSSNIERVAELGYIKVRPVVVYPTLNDREVVCQGILCPTVYNAEDRAGNSPFVQSSWFARANAPCDVESTSTSSALNNYDWRIYDSTFNQRHTMGIESKAGALATDNARPQYNFETPPVYLKMNIVNKGSWPEFRHNTALASSDKRNCEIQCMDSSQSPRIDKDTDTDTNTASQVWKSNNREQFFVDQSILTFHSPDIEFNTQVRSLDSSNLKLRIVGIVPLTAFDSNIDIQTSSPAMSKSEEDASSWMGLYKEPINTENFTTQGWKCLISAPLWLDGANKVHSGWHPRNGKYGWLYVIYPWQRTGSLNNAKQIEGDDNVSSKLSHKILLNTRFSYNSLYLAENKIWYAWQEGDSLKTGITGVQMFDSNEIIPIRIPSQGSGLPDMIYYGNVDKIITYPTTSTETDSKKSQGYPIMVANYGKQGENLPAQSMHEMFSSNYIIMSNGYTGDDDNIGDLIEDNTIITSGWDRSTSPISMKYKSTPHAVLALRNTNSDYQRVLPTFEDIKSGVDNPIKANFAGITFDYSEHLFWDTKNAILGVSQDVISASDFPNDGKTNHGVTNTTRYGFLWLGELYNDTITSLTRFGGQSSEALENNKWEVAGEDISLYDDYDNLKDSLTVKWTEGDTYYQRYDCLKTFPFNQNDENSVTEVVSFMCETRVNIDGRYDRNRGQVSNLYISPNNFNLLNSVYSQSNNFFTYRSTNLNKLNISDFPNTITWTKTKTLGEDVDSWTNITLASTLDLDGNKGRVRALRRFNDSLLAFQDEGISQILYNENVQIASTTGVPIEIANSGKVSGKRYISNHIGCTNKWSICSTPNGLYFIDDRTKDIYLFNGQLDNISDRLGFHSWMVQNFPNIEVWNPEDFGGAVTYYDNVNQDVFFVTKDSCLTFNENLGNFSSFYSYEHTPYFTNLEGKGIAWQKAANDAYYKPWGHQEGDYNKFFGEYQPYWTTVIVNPDPTFDKTFNNLEFRADSFDNNTYLPNETFDHLNVWNEYQNGECVLTNTLNRPSTLKKKFRIWRALIPRSNENHRDRMRNPWLYLKLSKQGSNTYKTVLHDLIVDYFD